MRLPRLTWLALLLSAPLALVLVIVFALDLGPRDFRALGKRLLHRQTALETLWSAPETEGDLADFCVSRSGQLVAIRKGGLWAQKQGVFESLTAPQGLLHLFPEGPNGQAWVAGTYHRVLVWGAEGLHHVVTVRGTVRGVQCRGNRLVVGFEEAALGRGLLMILERGSGALFEPQGVEIPIGLDRWSNFDLSPDGRRVVANLPEGKGVGVWSTSDGALLASWGSDRLARILCFVDDERVLFDQGPALKIRDAAFANPGNRLEMAQVGTPGTTTVLVDDFAAVLSFTLWPSRSRMAFSDAEGLVRVVELGGRPHLASVFAPKGKGIPWQLRATETGLWVYLKGESNRLDRFQID